ncbi:MAG: hypothetical protein K8I27_14325 [Planctomycetes bacterium]|nr:hypothetical protein [Planctomycetota bacterium]
MACRIEFEFEFEGELVRDLLLVIEPAAAENVKDGKVQLPRWMWEHGASIGWPDGLPEVSYEELHPPGSLIRIDYPLKGREVAPESATGQTTYNGYVGIPRRPE